MKPHLAALSLLSFGVSVAMWLLITVFESALVNLAPALERILLFVLLVLPPAIGAVFGVMSFVRKESVAWLSITATILNGLFALFQMTVLLFAG